MLVSRVTLVGTVLAPGLINQAENICLGIAEPFGLPTPILTQFFQLPVCYVSAQGLCREIIGRSPIRHRHFMHRTEKIVRNMQIVPGCHIASSLRVPHRLNAGVFAHSQFRITLPLRPDAITSKPC